MALNDDLARAAQVVGCRPDALDNEDKTRTRTFDREFDAAVGLVRWFERTTPRPLPTAGQVRQWLRKLGDAFAPCEQVEAEASDMCRYFHRLGAPECQAISRVWNYTGPLPEDHDLAGSLRWLEADHVFQAELNFGYPTSQWRFDVLSLYKAVGGGGRPAKNHNARRWAARGAWELLRVFSPSKPMASAHVALTEVVWRSATSNEDVDFVRLCREERLAFPIR